MRFTLPLRIVVYWICVLPAGVLRAQQLDGTLFTTPEEREYLDYLRAEFQRNSAEAGFDIQEVDIPEIPEEIVDSGPDSYSFGGAMIRRDSSYSVWLNGALLDESSLPAGFSLVDTNRDVSLRFARDGNVYVLRPGQTLVMETGTIIENFQRQAAVPPAEEPEEQAAEESEQTEQQTAEQAASADAATEPAEAVTADTTVTAAQAEEPAPPGATPATPPVEETAEDIDTAVAELSDAEADELAAALARRRDAEARATASE